VTAVAAAVRRIESAHRFLRDQVARAETFYGGTGIRVAFEREDLGEGIELFNTIFSAQLLRRRPAMPTASSARCCLPPPISRSATQA